MLAIVFHKRGWNAYYYVLLIKRLVHLPLCVHKDWHACHYVLRTYKRLVHLPLCVTQEGVCMRDWHAGQHALLKRVTGMFASMCYSACLPLCITQLARLLLGVI